MWGTTTPTGQREARCSSYGFKEEGWKPRFARKARFVRKASERFYERFLSEGEPMGIWATLKS